jgi:hypothetical protein
MNDGSKFSLASGDQVAEGTASLPTLAHLGPNLESEQRSLYGQYIIDNKRHAAMMVDRYRVLSQRDTPFVYGAAQVMKVLEPGHVQTAMRHAIHHSDISAAAAEFTGGQPFDTSNHRIERLNSLMAKDGNLAIVDDGMTNFLSKRHTALDKMKPDEPFLTNNQTERQKRFAKNVVDEMSACASTAVALLSKEPSFVDISNQDPEDDTPENSHLRLLELYANPESMTCGTAREFFKAIYSKYDPATTECETAFDALKSYSKIHATAAKKAVENVNVFDSNWLLRNWPKSSKPDLDKYPSKLREEILQVSHLIRGSKAGDQYKDSQRRQKTDHELLADAIEATRKPDPTIPGDNERWLCEFGSRLPSSVSPTDLGPSQSTPPSELDSSSIPPPYSVLPPEVPPSDLGYSSTILPSNLGHSPKIPPSKPLKPIRMWSCQSTRNDGASEGTDTRSDLQAEQE